MFLKLYKITNIVTRMNMKTRNGTEEINPFSTMTHFILFFLSIS
ncbi:hypothetical protein E2C01_078990 [Portunus trituberculatus]|uniref:Uncharacterized protein n=1 Tax=Portunus trituberculatus TaxID=210409 RepID=A0A5B7IQ77_PORTR|nr:hypothetical protein [Portunus trituberculatus]